MTQRAYVGVDPGTKGGVTVITADGVAILALSKCTEKDVWLYFENLRGFAAQVSLEKVHSMPLDGVASAFKFGQSYGFLRGCLIASGLPFQEVAPQAWQKAMGVVTVKKTTKSQRKQRYKQKAEQLFPNKRITLEVADSVLLAEYCRRLHANSF